MALEPTSAGTVSAPTGGFRWMPTPEVISKTYLAAFIKENGLPDIDAMLERSERDPAWFWRAVLKWADIQFFEPYKEIVDLSGGIEWAKWCTGGTTNIVLNCFDRHRNTPTYKKTFMVWEGEDGGLRQFTYAEFDKEICRAANALRSIGVRKGDVVALFMPVIPEAFIAYFAILKIGAIVMPLYSGFGAKALSSRLNEGSAKLVFSVDGARRRGQVVSMKSTLDEALAECPSVKHCVITRDLANDVEWTDGRDISWDDFISGQDAGGTTEPMQSTEPAILLFTSGTTGKPKGVVYTHIGTLGKMSCDMALCFDFQSSDRYFWMCDLGWMAGSIVAILPPLQGGSVLIADGAPDFPKPDRLWDMVEKHRVSYLAVTPTMIRAMMKQPDASRIAGRRFETLRVVYSSGEPWTDTPWNWLFKNICKEKIPILNGTGGTEVGGCILGCSLHHALKPSSFSMAMPAMGADIIDLSGAPVPPGTIGELILRKASIGLTSGLWHDPQRYIESYWSTVPGVWVHGDLTYRDSDGHWYVPGRSDDTMNVAGRRIAPAEVENVLMETQLVAEAAAIAVPDNVTGVAMVCVCVLKPAVPADAATRQSLVAAVGNALGRSYRPKRVIFAGDLPKTRSSKIMRRAVRAAVTGEPAGDLSALSNPEAIDDIRTAAAEFS